MFRKTSTKKIAIFAVGEREGLTHARLYQYSQTDGYTVWVGYSDSSGITAEKTVF